MGVSQFFQSIFGVERVHLERRHVNEKTRSDEFVVHLMIAQDMANVLAEKTFDAFPEFLNAIDVGLLHPPRAVGCIGQARLERFDSPLHQKIPRHVRDQIFDDWKRFHRLDCDRLLNRQLAQAGHAHELWHAVHFGRTRSAFPSFAVPSTSEVVRLGPLNLMNGI